MPKVSVIIPVYNVSKYIENCTRSLFEQTLDDIEYIFVDDCSPDDSIDIIQKVLLDYPIRELQTKIIKMPSNSGLAAVRRRGIIEATGDFIIHCDGDDWVDTDLYGRMYDNAISYDSDIVICDEIYEYAISKSYTNINLNYNSGKEVVRNWYKDTPGLFCHNKLVRRSLYVDNEILPWVGLDMWEDNGLMARLFYFANKISKVDGSFYHYNRCNVSAMTAGYGEKQIRQMILVARNLDEFFASQSDAPEFYKTSLAFKYLAKLNLITNSFSKLKEFRTLFPESDHIRKFIPLSAFSRKGRIRFLMVKYHFAWLFILLFKSKEIIHKLR